jgi:hypothetical protein
MRICPILRASNDTATHFMQHIFYADLINNQICSGQAVLSANPITKFGFNFKVNLIKGDYM